MYVYIFIDTHTHLTNNNKITINRDTASAECPANPWRIQNQALFGR